MKVYYIIVIVSRHFDVIYGMKLAKHGASKTLLDFT